MKFLINLFSTDLNQQDFVSLSEPFDSEGYSIYNFQFSSEEYSIDLLDTLINYLSFEHNISPYETKIVLQSNINNLLIAWYRIYNDIIDDFILIDNSVTSIELKNPIEQIFIDQLSAFAAIEDESCHTRLYYRNSSLLSPQILKPFMEAYQYDLLKPFNEHSVHSVVHKKREKKEYKIKQYSYLRSTTLEDKSKIIDLTRQRTFQKNILIDEINEASGFYLVFQYILSLQIADDQKARAVHMFQQRMNTEQKKLVTEYIKDYLEERVNILPFKEVINYYSFLVMLGTDKTIIKQMLEYIKNDDKHFDDHYAPFTNVLFYVTNASQKEYETYFLDRIDIMRQLKSYYKEKLKIQMPKSEDNHLVIVCGQLLSYNHAPTKVTIDYANNLIKYYPNLKIKIVVEDMFNYSPNELFFVYPFCSVDSKSLNGLHKELLDPSIEIHYSNCRLSRIHRLQEDINAIKDFKPQWIFKIGAPDSLAVDLLFDYYPITSLSMGGAEYSEWVDVALAGYTKDSILLELKEKGLEFLRYHYSQYIPGLEFAKSKNKVSRSEFSFGTTDFVIVTVGNRLEIDMDQTFIMEMRTILLKNKQVKWLIIGLEEHSLVHNAFGVLNKQVSFLKYANDLAAVYTICDLYANPFRKGGGFSVAMAIDAGIPVANLEGPNDANGFVPKGKALRRSEYFNYIQRLINDNEYYKNEQACFKGTIEKRFGFKNATKRVMDLLHKSEEIALKRYHSKGGNVKTSISL
ncbi:glycosyltransferase family 4 protein [Bacillus sp. 31A1R]|uniref:Glycosyltransferase family 4 protein n=1 Tax=Robertmurraya mangrovi TaxID=3098077 RepID=A0ABU5IXT6_9BACI|nr:glycosyltransferase family 4 protein [Bacillus sp. 31A1R]MDZ5471968.1 glycosyltransferase family 4 protein [Bacillus sp. 31A1R]